MVMPPGSAKQESCFTGQGVLGSRYCTFRSLRPILSAMDSVLIGGVVELLLSGCVGAGVVLDAVATSLGGAATLGWVLLVASGNLSTAIGSASYRVTIFGAGGSLSNKYPSPRARQASKTSLIVFDFMSN